MRGCADIADWFCNWFEKRRRWWINPPRAERVTAGPQAGDGLRCPAETHLTVWKHADTAPPSPLTEKTPSKKNHKFWRKLWAADEGEGLTLGLHLPVCLFFFVFRRSIRGNESSGPVNNPVNKPVNNHHLLCRYSSDLNWERSGNTRVCHRHARTPTSCWAAASFLPDALLSPSTLPCHPKVNFILRWH